MVTGHEDGVRRDAIGPQDATESGNDDRRRAGPTKSGRRTLGAGTADVRVVEEEDASTRHGGAGLGGYLEGVGVRSHVPDGCGGADQDLGRPARADQPGPDGSRQTFHVDERRPTSGGRGHGEREAEVTTSGRTETGSVLCQEAVEEVPHHRGEAAARLVDR